MFGLAAGGATQAHEDVDAQAQATACPDGICPGLGHAYYLPSINGFDPPSSGNDFLIDKAIGSCATVTPAKEMATRQFQSSESMQELTRKTTASFELNTTYTSARLSARASVSAMTGGDTTTTQRMTSTHMDITTPTRNVDFNQRGRDCFAKGNVHPDDIRQFESLPLVRAAQASQAGEWAPYENYLRRSGSHLMIRQQFGSRFQRWESSSASTSDILDILKAKACAGVEGRNPTTQGWSVDGCAAYSREQREKASRTHSEWRQIVMGGTEATRIALTQEVSKTSIDNFIAASPRGDRPIRFGFKPVWELWMEIYSPLCRGDGSKDCENLQRAYNLKTAFEGRLAIGCPEERDGTGTVYQAMAADGAPNAQGIQTFGCFAERTGCRSNQDCRLGGAGAVCYCYGRSCIDQGVQIIGSDQFRNRVRTRREGGYDDGVNNSCRLRSGIGSSCSCNTSWGAGLPRRDLFREPLP
ncbi:MAG TPA: hypothetical protein VLF18_19120 [Tahibacter sp.]|uniref:hypothetical protein n=1 Tax=Tahibacter sp. TaxID=2056211 RepID=UPI002BA82B61|nr:hypothetical protein [Tahibacter sp.]HSX62301.1 hypothetical protein [Tahibacter sp.]